MSAKKNDTSCPSEVSCEWDGVVKKTRRALGENLLSVRQVAGTEQDEHVEGLSTTALHEKTGIARSTIQKLIDGENNKGPSNPDLETLCRLAWALNVPPAFLLMTADDWKRLIEAINTMQGTVQQSPVLYESVLKNIESNKSTAGLELVKRLGTYPDAINWAPDVGTTESNIDEWQRDIERRNEIKRRSILAMTALAQSYSNTIPVNSSQRSKREYLATLTTLAAIFGAGVQTN